MDAFSVEHAMDIMTSQAEILERAKVQEIERRLQLEVDRLKEEAAQQAQEAKAANKLAELMRRKEARKERVVRKEDIKRMAPSIRTLLRSGWQIRIEEPNTVPGTGDKFDWSVIVPGIGTISHGIAKDRTAALRRARRAMKKHYMADTNACRDVKLVPKEGNK